MLVHQQVSEAQEVIQRELADEDKSDHSDYPMATTDDTGDLNVDDYKNNDVSVIKKGYIKHDGSDNADDFSRNGLKGEQKRCFDVVIHMFEGAIERIKGNRPCNEDSVQSWKLEIGDFEDSYRT